MAFSFKTLSARFSDIGDAIIIRHTVFSLPFAILAIALESGGRPPIHKLILIVLAAVSGRNAANALNRIIDAKIDARNPRTADRAIPSGKLSSKSLWIFTAIMLILLAGSAWLLGPLCLALLPLAAVLIFGYSYTKRFTWLCHFWLGITCAAAPMGAFIAISGRLELRFFLFSAAHALWVAGFDMIYALGDIDFDRSEGIHSVPARFGIYGARLYSGLCHALSVTLLFFLPAFWKLGWLWMVAVVLTASLLFLEHFIARKGSKRHIIFASYTINEFLPFIILAFGLLEVYFF